MEGFFDGVGVGLDVTGDFVGLAEGDELGSGVGLKLGEIVGLSVTQISSYKHSLPGPNVCSQHSL